MKYISVLSQHTSQSYQGSRAEEFPCGVVLVPCLQGRGKAGFGAGRMAGCTTPPPAPWPRVREDSADHGTHSISHPSPLLFLLKCSHAHSQTQHLDHSSALFTASLCPASTAGWRPGLRMGRVEDGEMDFEMGEKGKSDKFCGSGQVGE